MAQPFESKYFRDLVALRRPSGEVVAFHARNLQVAQLSDSAWEAMENPEQNSEALEALKAWNDSQDPQVRRELNETGIQSLSINVTQVCNLQCRYCAAGGDGSYGDPIKRISVEETIPTLTSFMTRAPEGGKFEITFLGGEPLLYPQGIQVLAETAQSLAKLRNLRLIFTIVTNGTQFTPQNIELLKSFSMNVTVSLDGPAQVNDRQRPSKSGKGMTAVVEEGLARLLKNREGLGKVLISGVFGRDNLDLMKAYLYYRQFAVDGFDFTFDHHETAPKVTQYYLESLSEVAALAYQLSGEKGLRQIQPIDRIFDLLDRQQQIENYCGAGKSFLMVDARQNLTICPWMVGNPKEVVGHGGEVWGERLEAYQAPLIETNGCGSCWARYLCGGGCMYIHQNATGDRHRVDNNYCQRTRFLIETTLLYYEKARAS